MKTPPVVHGFGFQELNHNLRLFLLKELVGIGEPNVVLTTRMVAEIMSEPGLLELWQTWLKESGANFGCCHFPFGPHDDLNIPFAPLRKHMLARQKLALEIVAQLGVTIGVMHVGNARKNYTEFSIDQLTDFAVETLEELLPLAEELGVKLAIENIWTPTTTPERLISIVEHFDSPWLGLCYDSGHANLMARERDMSKSVVPVQWEGRGAILYDDKVLEKMLPHVTIVHLQDNDGLRDLHLMPGQGEIDWEHVMGLLRQAPKLEVIQNESNSVAYGGSFTEVSRCFRDLVGDRD